MKVVNKLIEMIACYRPNQKPEPIKFKLEEGKYKEVEIVKVVDSDLEKLGGNLMCVYTCMAVIDNVEKTFELKYDIANMNWILWKL